MESFHSLAGKDKLLLPTTFRRINEIDKHCLTLVFRVNKKLDGGLARGGWVLRSEANEQLTDKHAYDYLLQHLKDACGEASSVH